MIPMVARKYRFFDRSSHLIYDYWKVSETHMYICAGNFVPEIFVDPRLRILCVICRASDPSNKDRRSVPWGPLVLLLGGASKYCDCSYWKWDRQFQTKNNLCMTLDHFLCKVKNNKYSHSALLMTFRSNKKTLVGTSDAFLLCSFEKLTRNTLETSNSSQTAL